MIHSENAVIIIRHAEQGDEYKARLGFNDGTQHTIDLAPFLRQSRNPLIQAHLDLAAFACFTVKDGELIWNDYDLCFPIADLYEGRV
jgi:hypothetical protein